MCKFFKTILAFPNPHLQRGFLRLAFSRPVKKQHTKQKVGSAEKTLTYLISVNYGLRKRIKCKQIMRNL